MGVNMGANINMGANLGANMGSNMGVPPSPDAKEPLPPDWIELPIYYNTTTGQTSWERPRQVVMAGDRFI